MAMTETHGYHGAYPFKGVITITETKGEEVAGRSGGRGVSTGITLLPLPTYTKLEKSTSEPNVSENNKETTPRNSFDDTEDDAEEPAKTRGSKSEGHLGPEENVTELLPPAPTPLPPPSPPTDRRESLSAKVDQTHIDEGRKRLTDGDCRMIPDYSASGVMNGQQMNTDGLILPRKPHNPCMDSMERQNLHRELLLNQKIGKSVLNQKSELQRALEKHKESQSKKELEQQRLECRTPFERIIEERAKRLETLEKQTVIEPPASNKPEFLRVHAKLRAKMDSK
nr:PREDICTED: uncharacterized protein LOC109033031 [Bemisia tabaci]